jgi:hypothetical protein
MEKTLRRFQACREIFMSPYTFSPYDSGMVPYVLRESI